MSDDIVIRLKKMNGLLTDMEWLTVIEAAYEIERLRRNRDRWRNTAHDLARQLGKTEYADTTYQDQP